MSRTATIRSLPQTFEMIKEMEAQGHEFGGDYREAGRRGLVGVLEAGMQHRFDGHLEALARRGEADRRNGSYRRWLLTEQGGSSSACRARGASAPVRRSGPTPGGRRTSIA